MRARGLAQYWQHLLYTGKVGSLREIAAAEGMDLGQVSRIARLAWVGTRVVEGNSERRFDLGEEDPQHGLTRSTQPRRK